MEAYGTKSGAFAKAGSWWFITCGFTTNPNNSKCVSRKFELKDLAYVTGNRDYDPFPVALGSPEGFDPWIGYDAAKAHGLVVQDAIDRLYQSQLLDGYRHKLEGAFAVFPGSANRVNLHGHAVANGGETNGQFLAEELFSAMEGGLQKHRQHLDRDYFPDVLVLKINSPSDLERCIRYSEKVIPVDLIVAQALERPEAGSRDAKWNDEFFLKLHEALI